MMMCAKFTYFGSLIKSRVKTTQRFFCNNELAVSMLFDILLITVFYRNNYITDYLHFLWHLSRKEPFRYFHQFWSIWGCCDNRFFVKRTKCFPTMIIHVETWSVWDCFKAFCTHFHWSSYLFKVSCNVQDCQHCQYKSE